MSSCECQACMILLQLGQKWTCWTGHHNTCTKSYTYAQRIGLLWPVARLTLLMVSWVMSWFMHATKLRETVLNMDNWTGHWTGHLLGTHCTTNPTCGEKKILKAPHLVHINIGKVYLCKIMEYHGPFNFFSKSNRKQDFFVHTLWHTRSVNKLCTCEELHRQAEIL